MSTLEAQMWKEAINSEIESILSNHTWKLANFPPDSKSIGCKWIFKRKLKPDGSMDKCVYTKIVGNACIIVCLYVDDMLILGTNIEIIKSTKRMLSNTFDMKGLGVADVILGIKITRTPDEISLSQSHYVEKMIERFKDHGIKENTNPFLPHIHLHKNTGTRIRQLEYSQIIGSLMNLMNCTRPDIAYWKTPRGGVNRCKC